MLVLQKCKCVNLVNSLLNRAWWQLWNIDMDGTSDSIIDSGPKEWKRIKENQREWKVRFLLSQIISGFRHPNLCRASTKTVVERGAGKSWWALHMVSQALSGIQVKCYLLSAKGYLSLAQGMLSILVWNWFGLNIATSSIVLGFVVKPGSSRAYDLPTWCCQRALQPLYSKLQEGCLAAHFDSPADWEGNLPGNKNTSK